MSEPEDATALASARELRRLLATGSAAELKAFAEALSILHAVELTSLVDYLRAPEHAADRAAKLHVLVQAWLVARRVAHHEACRHLACLRCELRRAAAACGALDALAPLLLTTSDAAACDSRCLDRPELFDAAEAGQADAVRALLQWRPDPADVNPRDPEQAGMTPLMLAVDAGHAACVAALPSAPFILVDAADEQHRTALSHAVSARRGAIIAQLLAAGANPLALEPGVTHRGLPGRAGNSPLHRAAAVVADEGAVCVRLLACAAVRGGRSLDTLATAGQPNTSALGGALLARAFAAAVALRFCGAAHFHLTRTDDSQRHRALVPHLPPQAVPFFFSDAPPAWTPQLHRFCPPACRAAVAELLRCGERGRRVAAADAADDEGAALWRLPAPLLQRVVATVVSGWCSAPPWPFELAAFDAAVRPAAPP